MDGEMVWVRLAVPYAEAVRARISHPGLVLTDGPAGHRAGRKAVITFRGLTDEPLETYDWVHIAGAGADHVMRALPKGGRLPLLTRTVGKMGRQIGEYVLSYALADLQLHERRARFQAERRWDIESLEGGWLFQTEIAVLGVGGVAQGIAEMLSPLARRIVGYARTARDVSPFAEVRPLDDFQHADIVINALPATPATDGLIGGQIFSRCAGSLFINIGRGATLDEGALVAALDNGRLRRAVLDVFRQEPLPEDHRFWRHPHIITTPHVSGITRPEDTADAFLAHLPAFLDGSLVSTVKRNRGY